MDPRLKGAIGNPRIQNQAQELVALALRALEDLKQLDESLYERFVASRTANTSAAAADDLRELWDHTFGGVLELLAFCQSLEGQKRAPAPDLDGGDDALDFGELEGGDHATVTELDLGAADFGELLDGIDQKVQGDDEKWADALEKVSSIEYGLRSQYTDATQRLHVALAGGETNQVLALLDDTQSALSEGVHALVTAVYQAFVPAVDVTTVVPGYFTQLGRALLVRRGLAQLATTLGPNNDVLQGDEPERFETVLSTIRGVMQNFVGSVVCRAMRAADRWQMVEFERDLAEQPLRLARQTSEGLVKYLDSLRSINQREVLVVHDQRALEEMRESLATARGLIDISPRTAQEMIERAHQAAQRLRGRSPATDQQLARLERYAAMLPPPQLLEQLEGVLAQAGS